MAEPFASWKTGLAFTAFARQERLKLTPGDVRLSGLDDPSLVLRCRLGPEPIVPTTGFWSWDVLSKPTATTSAGRPPMQLPVPLVISRFRVQKSVEPEIETLQRMMGLRAKDGELPPTLRIEGPGIPHAYGLEPSRVWVTTGDPDWQEVRKLPSGERCLVRVMITLVTLSKAEVLPDPKNTRRVTFTVPDGTWTGTRVHRAFGLSWRGLRKLNPDLKADPSRKLKRGTLVRVA